MGRVFRDCPGGHQRYATLTGAHFGAHAVSMTLQGKPGSGCFPPLVPMMETTYAWQGVSQLRRRLW